MTVMTRSKANPTHASPYETQLNRRPPREDLSAAEPSFRSYRLSAVLVVKVELYPTTLASASTGPIPPATA